MLKNPRIVKVNKNMKKIFANNFTLLFLVLIASTLSLIFVQQRVLSAWAPPNANPGDNTPVSVPLTIDASANVDVNNSSLININDLRVKTLTATTSINVLGTLTADTFNTSNIGVSELTIPYGSMQGIIDITAKGSLDITADNAVMIGTVTKAGLFSAGIASGGGMSYGLYADTDALSSSFNSYAVTGVANNAGGVAVYGLANAGWAGYFFGPIGVTGSVAFGNDSTANGLYGFAVGHSAAADGDYSLAFGSITVSGADSVGINLDDTVAETLSQANSMAIMGGNLGIGTVTPSYKLHLVGNYYQDGMMQVTPKNALLAGENIIYGNLPNTSDSGANLLLLQNNAVDKFKVSALGAGIFAGSLTATQATFSSGLVVNGSTATINAGASVAGTLGMKTGGVISFNASAGSYFDFNDDSGAAAPTCTASTAGVVYNFKVNNILCYCDGTTWFSMVVGKAASLCSSK